MRYSSIASVSALIGCVASSPLAIRASSPFPLPDGFPTPNASQLKTIETLAGGTLPNSPLPTELTATATAALQLIALNEIFEVAYFTDLLKNITSHVPGYELTGLDRNYIIDTLTAVANQEKLHFLGVNAALTTAGQTPIQPCKYKYPVKDFLSAITLAQTFTDVVLGVLPQAQTLFGADGGDESGLVNLFGSVIAQEAEQNGWYRSVQKKIPSAAPFLTTEGPSFAFTFLQSVIVPGSCPNIKMVADAIPTFGALTVVSRPKPYDSLFTFSVPGTIDNTNFFLTYLSGQNLPVTVPITKAKTVKGVTTFNAQFPYATAGFARGLTVAAVVQGVATFNSSAEVAAATVYGPGIIEVN